MRNKFRSNRHKRPCTWVSSCPRWAKVRVESAEASYFRAAGICCQLFCYGGQNHRHRCIDVGGGEVPVMGGNLGNEVMTWS